MDFIRGMLPYIKVPRLNDISISDGLCGCVACRPFRKPRRRKGVWGGRLRNPSQEVTTISSLMDKLKADGRRRRRGPAVTEGSVVYGFHQTGVRTSGYPQPGTGSSSFSLRRNFGKDGSRPVGFSYEMKHEKFTPCKVTRECTVDNATRAGHSGAGFSSYAFGGNRNAGSVIVAPPRRKRLSRRLLSDSSTDGSLDSVVNREIWNNTRNLELNNSNNGGYGSGVKTDRPLIIPTHTQGSINRSNQNDVNHNHKINNKSGCSRIDVDSASVGVNETHFMQLGRSRVNKIVINRQDELVTYCENKVYYKNSEPDEYGNYPPGSDADEIIVCESIINVEPVTKPIPDDATYTRLYSDSLYRDDQEQDDGVSSSSFDAHFDKIVRLKSDTNLQIRSPFQRFMLKRQEQKQRSRDRQSTWKDSGGIIPVHRPANESFESIKAFVAPSRTSEPDFNWTSTAGAQMQMQAMGCIRI